MNRKKFTKIFYLIYSTDNQVGAKEELLEDDVTDSVLCEIERVDTFDETVGTGMADVTLNETENVALPSNFENLLNSCSSLTSTNNALSAASTSNCNSNGLSSREANAICIVLGEISPLLQRYDSGKTIFKRLQKEKVNASVNFKDHLLNTRSILQQQVIRKLCDLRSELECWENHF